MTSTEAQHGPKLPPEAENGNGGGDGGKRQAALLDVPLADVPVTLRVGQHAAGEHRPAANGRVERVLRIV